MRYPNRRSLTATFNKFAIFVTFCALLVVHTQAQAVDSIGKPKPLRFSYRQLYVPGGLMFSGIVFSGKGSNSLDRKIADFRNEHMPNAYTKADDFVSFSPLVLTYGFEVFGMKPKTDFLNRSVIVFKSELIMFASVEILKRATHVLRPDSSAFTSFPSGHTAQAFLGAAILSEEYGYQHKWVPWVAYCLASSVGVLRITNNKHYLSDVLFGAGLGIMSAKVAYWTNRYKWGKKKNKEFQF